MYFKYKFSKIIIIKNINVIPLKTTNKKIKILKLKKLKLKKNIKNILIIIKKNKIEKYSINGKIKINNNNLLIKIFVLEV